MPCLDQKTQLNSIPYHYFASIIDKFAFEIDFGELVGMVLGPGGVVGLG
jgi:hypothetical protein